MSKRERNFRRVIFVIALICIILLLCGNVRKSYGQPEPMRYCVSAGDTLWKIAKENKPNHMSYQKYIDTIYKLNDDLSADIYPGQAILVPVYEKK